MPLNVLQRSNSFPQRLKAATDPEVEKKIFALVAKEDECRVACEVSKDDGGKPRIIAIVCPQHSSSQPEYAMFVIKKKKLRSKLMIRNVVPILSDFSVRRVNNLSVEIKYRKYNTKTKTKVFTASNADTLSAWIEAASNALVVACHQNYNLDSFYNRKSHSWLLERYADDVPSLKQMMGGPVKGDLPQNSDGSDSDDAPDHPVALTMMTEVARGDWIQKQCLKRADEYVEKRKVSVRVCSWNVGAQLRPEEGRGPQWHPESLARWLIPKGTNGCDIISVGLQEIVELQTNSLIAHDSSPERKAWEELLCTALQVPRKYVMLVSRQYVGVYHFLAVRKDLWDASIVREPQCKAVGCGIMGFGGNKGAVSVRLVVYDSDVCFVCCHLAAGRAQVERRNRDVKLILKSTLFDGTNRHGVVAPCSGTSELNGKGGSDSLTDREGGGTPLSARSSASRGGASEDHAESNGRHGFFKSNSFGRGERMEQVVKSSSFGRSERAERIEPVVKANSFNSFGRSECGGTEAPASTGSNGSGGGLEEEDGGVAATREREVKGIEDHDVVIWLGDLNYRIDVERDEALSEIARDNLPNLWSKDQLRRQREEGAVFTGYSEGRPLFLPTYKLDPATGDYYNKSDKIRTPSWCDRVLWRTSRAACRQVSYTSEMHLPGSDHRPIGTTLELTVEEILAAKKAKVREAVEAELDHLAGECQPQAAVDIEELELVSVRYRRRERREVRLRNVGQVAVHFNVGTVMQGAADKAAWMQVTPERGVLMPQESIKLDIIVHIGDRVAAAILGDGTTTLEAIVTFCIDGGVEASHPTVAVRAVCLPTCFGRTLQNLASQTCPVRKSMNRPPSSPGVGTSMDKHALGQGSMLPKEIWRLVEGLSDPRGLRAHRLFLDYGSTTEAAEVRECLDTGRAFPAGLSPQALGEVLLQLLRSMPVPVVPAGVRDQCVLKHQSAEGVMAALSLLPPHHTTALVYIVSFLRTLPLQSKLTGVTAEELALVFAGALLSPDRLSRNRVSPAVLGELRREQQVMLHLLSPSGRTAS